MYKNKTFLAIIPARGGSKRLPRKNILSLHGKPLIVWSIEAGKKCSYIDNVIVSSDDEEILNISKDNGVETIKRESHLASDSATTLDVLVDVIVRTDKKYDYIVLLQPTSPLRNETHIKEAIQLLEEKHADAIVSVCEMDHSPLWSNTLPQTGDMRNFMRDEIKNKRSQDFETFYRLNGAIYICKTERLLSEHTLFIKDRIFAYIMDRDVSIDIDEALDFEIANLIMSKTL